MMRIVVMYPTWGEARPFMLGSAGGTAEVWRCDWVTILDARVWAADPSEPVAKMPLHI